MSCMGLASQGDDIAAAISRALAGDVCCFKRHGGKAFKLISGEAHPVLRNASANGQDTIGPLTVLLNGDGERAIWQASLWHGAGAAGGSGEACMNVHQLRPSRSCRAKWRTISGSGSP